jgi:hypothetical protein
MSSCSSRPNDLAEPALEHLLLDRREHVLRLLEVRELEVRIARHPERIPAEDLHPRKERLQVLADDVLERHELVSTSGHEHPAREALGNLDACEVDGAEHRVANFDRQ